MHRAVAQPVLSVPMQLSVIPLASFPWLLPDPSLPLVGLMPPCMRGKGGSQGLETLQLPALWVLTTTNALADNALLQALMCMCIHLPPCTRSCLSKAHGRQCCSLLQSVCCCCACASGLLLLQQHACCSVDYLRVNATFLQVIQS